MFSIILSAFAVLSTLVILHVIPRLKCPTCLRHLPRVSMFATLLSLLTGETEERRVKRLMLPVAEEHGAGLVVVWAIGGWYVHVLDFEVSVHQVEFVMY